MKMQRTEAEQEKALVFYNNTYSPNKGIDIAAKNGKEFNVAAAKWYSNES